MILFRKDDSTMWSSEWLVKVTGNVGNLGIQQSMCYLAIILLIDGLLQGRHLKYYIVTVWAISGAAWGLARQNNCPASMLHCQSYRKITEIRAHPHTDRQTYTHTCARTHADIFMLRRPTTQNYEYPKQIFLISGAMKSCLDICWKHRKRTYFSQEHTYDPHVI
jgi:hypothetical protein